MLTTAVLLKNMPCLSFISLCMGQDTMMQENQSSTGEMIESSEGDSKEKSTGGPRKLRRFLLRQTRLTKATTQRLLLSYVIRSWKLIPRTEAHGNCSENSAGGIQNCTILIPITSCEPSNTL